MSKIWWISGIKTAVANAIVYVENGFCLQISGAETRYLPLYSTVSVPTVTGSVFMQRFSYFWNSAGRFTTNTLLSECRYEHLVRWTLTFHSLIFNYTVMKQVSRQILTKWGRENCPKPLEKVLSLNGTLEKMVFKLSRCLENSFGISCKQLTLLLLLGLNWNLAQITTGIIMFLYSTVKEGVSRDFYHSFLSQIASNRALDKQSKIVKQAR